MNKIKFKVTRINEDVITTSACEVSRLGWYYKDGGNYYYGYYTSSSSSSDNHPISSSSLPNGIGTFENNTDKYFYHADKNGGFIEWCPSADTDHKNADEARRIHGIE